MFPDNLVKACFKQVKTIYVPVDVTSPANENVTMNNSTIESEVKVARVLQDSDGMNVLGWSAKIHNQNVMLIEC